MESPPSRETPPAGTPDSTASLESAASSAPVDGDSTVPAETAVALDSGTVPGSTSAPQVDSLPAAPPALPAASDSAPPPAPAVAASPVVDSVAEPVAPANSPFVWLVVKSSAPVGSQVTVDGIDAVMDDSGKWICEVPTDSFRRAVGSYPVCLTMGGDPLCTRFRPQGFDTVEIAPLRVVVDSVVETRDTIRTVWDTTGVDSAALAMANSKGVLTNSQAGRKVVIRAKRKPRRVLGQEKVTITTIKRLPGLAEPDVMRAVQALPGVVASSDFSTKVYVRGSSSDQNLVLFDNAVVYSPSHFGGLFSTFLADVTGGLEFYKGGFDPRFGNRLASVLLVSSKTGGASAPDSLRWLEGKMNRWIGVTPAPSAARTDSASEGDSAASADSPAIAASSPAESPRDTLRFNGATRITTFGGSIALDGKLGEWSWAGGSRGTWIGTALEAGKDAGVIDFTLDYDFYDNQGDLAWGRDGDTVRISAYQGEDALRFAILDLDWGNTVVPVNVRKRLGDQMEYRGTWSYSDFQQRVKFGDIAELWNGIETWNTRQELQFDPVPEHRLTAGYELNTYKVLFRQNLIVAQVDVKEEPDNMLHAGWLQDRWNIGTNHTITAGLRGYWSRELESGSLDPRASWTWRFAPDWKYDLHMGRYTQYMTSLRFGDQESPNEFWYSARDPMEPSTQLMTSMGLERSNWTDLGLRTSIEAYYKSVDDLPIYFEEALTQGDFQDLDAQGKEFFPNVFQAMHGYAAGGELQVEKSDGWWTANVSYGLSFSALQQEKLVNSIDTIEFRPYWADWDQRNTFKTTGGLNWFGRASSEALSVDRKSAPTWVKLATTLAFPPSMFFWWMTKADYLRSSFQASYATGQPLTGYEGYQRSHEPFQGVDGGEAGGQPFYFDNNTRLVRSERNRDRKTDYFRLDVTPFDFGRTGKWRFYYSIINITDHENLFTSSWNTRRSPPEQDKTYQFPFLPIFMGYELEF